MQKYVVLIMYMYLEVGIFRSVWDGELCVVHWDLNNVYSL